MKEPLKLPRDKANEDLDFPYVVLAIIGLFILLSAGLPLWADAVAVIGFLVWGAKH